MDPEEELLNKSKKDQMRRHESQLSLEYEKKALETKVPELKRMYNQMALEHSQKARFLR